MDYFALNPQNAKLNSQMPYCRPLSHGITLKQTTSYTMDASALQNLTPEQKQAVMAQAQQQANQQIMSTMIESMTLSCFDKCAGTSGDKLDKKEQSW